MIDEYDVPLDKAYQNGYYQEMLSLLRALFGDALKTNQFLQFAVLTGCLRVSKESIFTGLNNFKVLSITDVRFDEQFGFTEEEVSKLLKTYHLEGHLPEIKRVVRWLPFWSCRYLLSMGCDQSCRSPL
ncbi:MAG: AAA family ATPase [Ruminococcus sp.]